MKFAQIMLVIFAVGSAFAAQAAIGSLASLTYQSGEISPKPAKVTPRSDYGCSVYFGICWT